MFTGAKQTQSLNKCQMHVTVHVCVFKMPLKLKRLTFFMTLGKRHTFLEVISKVQTLSESFTG